MQRNINQQMKKTMLSLMVLLPLFAQGATKGETMWAWSLQNIIFILGVVMIIIAFFVMYNVMTGMAKYQQREWLRAKGIEMPKEISTDKSTIFGRLYDKAWSLVPMEKEADIDLGHDYDGIRELDNRLPPWWVYLFYITIIWAIGYIYVSHFMEDRISQQDEYEIAMEEARVQQLQFLAQQANSVDETNVTVLEDQASLDAGKDIYVASCAACHGMQGEGGVGPNFTDQYWIHGGSINDLFKTIKYGVPEKGMISWKAQLQPGSMQKVASYILTLQGTNPPNQKKAEGELYVPEEKAETVSSSEES